MTTLLHISKRLTPSFAWAMVLVVSLVFTTNTVSAQNTGTLADDHTNYNIRPLPTIYGFATLHGGVTGGAGGQEVTVTNAFDFLRYASSNDPYIINVVDTIEIVKGIGNFAESAGEYLIGSNTTIRGIGPHATILYGGFRIQGVENVIVQNLTFDGTYHGFRSHLDQGLPCAEVPPGAHRYKNGPCLKPGDKAPTDDAIEIGDGAERILITQNTFKRYSDEIIGIKNAASYMTFSWNRFDDPITGKHGMMVLLGHSDNNPEDIGRLKTTFHHNYFGSRDRQPRIRYGQVHILNNYYDNPHGIFNYGAAAQRDSEVVVEGNYYNNIGSRPWRFDINSFQGYVNQRNNVFVNTSIAATRGTIGVEIFEPNDAYEYYVNDPDSIPAIVLANMGAANWDFVSDEVPIASNSKNILPANGSTVDRKPEVEWAASLFADSYQVQIGTSVIFDVGDVVLDTLLANVTSMFIEDALAPNGFFFWRVRAINEKGAGGWSSPTFFSTNSSTSIAHNSDFPQKFELVGNYPNPFNPSTSIRFGMPEAASVDLRVYDALGREVAVLARQQMYQPGYHTVSFDAGQLASGVYIYRIVAQPLNGAGASRFVQTKTMTLVK